MRWDKALVLGLFIIWMLGLLVLGGPDSPLSVDAFRLYASIPFLAPIGALVIVWGLEQVVILLRRLRLP